MLLLNQLNNNNKMEKEIKELLDAWVAFDHLVMPYIDTLSTEDLKSVNEAAHMIRTDLFIAMHRN